MSLIQRRHSLVNGYIRRCKLLRIIPNDLALLIFDYLNVNDLWSTKYSNKGFEIDAIGQCLTVIDKQQDSLTAFGSEVIECGSFRWKVRMKRLVHNAFNQSPFVGVIQESAQNLKKFKKSWNWHKCGFQIGGDGFYGCLNPNKCETDRLQTEKIGFNRSGNEIEIILNLDDCTIGCVINGIDKGVIFEQIPKTKYRFAISVHECYQSQFEFL